MITLERQKSKSSPISSPKAKSIKVVEGKNLYAIFSKHGIRKLLRDYIFRTDGEGIHVMCGNNILIKAYEITKNSRERITNEDILVTTGIM